MRSSEVETFECEGKHITAPTTKWNISRTKQHLFLQSIQLLPQSLDPHTWLQELLSRCAHRFVIHFWGNLGIVQLEDTISVKTASL